MSRSQSKRSKAWPNGTTKHAFVKEGNIMMCRCLLVLRLATALGIVWTLEQPVNSVAPYFERFNDFLAQIGAWRCTVKLGQLGATSAKPIVWAA